MHQSDTQHNVMAIGNAAEQETVFRRVYKQYWRSLYAVAYNRLRNPALAEDIVQEVFVDLWQKRQTLQLQHSLKVYLYAVLKHKVLDQIRRSSIREAFIQRMMVTTTEHDHITEDHLLCSDLENSLQQQLNQLPAQRRRIFELSRHEQLSYTEIATRLDIAPKTVENQLCRALKTLRWNLREFLPLLFVSWIGG